MLTNCARRAIDRNVLYATAARRADGADCSGNLICWPPIYHVTRIFDDVTRRDVAYARRSRGQQYRVKQRSAGMQIRQLIVSAR